MRKIILIVLCVLIISIIASGCITALEKSPVLTINLAVDGNYSNPVINVENTTRSLEYVENIKQPKYNVANNIPGVYCSVFYSQARISYETSMPYNGENEQYKFTIILKDDAPVPKANDAIVVLIQFIDKDGSLIKSQYISIRWPEAELDVETED